MKNDFWKFCTQFVLFVFLLFVVDRGVGAAFEALKNVGLERNPEDMWIKTPFVVEKVGADVIIIGSSRASHHYVPQLIEDALGLSTYNCGQDGCFFLYQNCIVNMLVDRYRPKTIIWDIQPGSFTQGGNSQEYQNIRYLSPYYYDHNAWALSYIDSESSKMKYRMYSQMFGYNSKFLNYLAPVLRGGSNTDKGYLPLPNEGYNYPTLNEKPVDVKYEISQEYLVLLDSTIRRCHELGVDIALFISPSFTQNSNAVVAAQEAIGKVALTHGIKCYDYLSDPLFLGDAAFFKDADHLNDKGARQFTEMIIDVLKQR